MNTNLSIDISFVPNWKTDIQNLITAINNLDGVKVADVKLGDLSFPADNCNGVYIFQEGDIHKIIEEGITNNDPQYWYVGKSDGRSLVDRIGAHLAPRHDDYMNCVIKNTAWVLSGIERQKDFYDNAIISAKKRQQYTDNALQIVLGLKLKIVCFGTASDPNVKADIRLAEKILIGRLNPFLNNPNRKPRQLCIKP